MYSGAGTGCLTGLDYHFGFLLPGQVQQGVVFSEATDKSASARLCTLSYHVGATKAIET